MASRSSSAGWVVNFTSEAAGSTTSTTDTGRGAGRSTAASGGVRGRQLQGAVSTADSSVQKRAVPKMVDAVYRIAERFGVPVVILAAVLWWAKTDIVQPLLNAHFQFIDRIVEGQEQHRQQVEDLGRKLDELIEISSR